MAKLQGAAAYPHLARKSGGVEAVFDQAVRWRDAFSVDAAASSRPEITQLLARGVCRMLIDHNYAPLLELPLANGRRADVVALGAKGDVIIVETKSCLDDYRVDMKWGEYAPFCDAFYFAVTEDFPIDV